MFLVDEHIRAVLSVSLFRIDRHQGVDRISFDRRGYRSNLSLAYLLYSQYLCLITHKIYLYSIYLYLTE